MEHTKKEVKYKTKREEEIYLKTLLFLGVSLGGIVILLDLYCVIFKGENVSEDFFSKCCLFFAMTIGLLYYFIPKYKRKIYAQKGELFAGNVIGADCMIQGRGEHAYYLIIAFYENGERKLRYSEPYAGSPRCKLRDTSCEVYKWKGKYIEGGLHGLYKGEESKNLPIPISEYHSRDRKKYDYV